MLEHDHMWLPDLCRKSTTALEALHPFKRMWKPSNNGFGRGIRPSAPKYQLGQHRFYLDNRSTVSKRQTTNTSIANERTKRSAAGSLPFNFIMYDGSDSEDITDDDNTSEDEYIEVVDSTSEEEYVEAANSSLFSSDETIQELNKAVFDVKKWWLYFPKGLLCKPVIVNVARSKKGDQPLSIHQKNISFVFHIIRFVGWYISFSSLIFYVLH
jgi:hypothetical protein